MGAGDYVRTVEMGESWCGDTGLCRKVHKHIKRITDNSTRSHSLESLRTVLGEKRNWSCRKGGSQPTVIEALFSICRMLGPIR